MKIGNVKYISLICTCICGFICGFLSGKRVKKSGAVYGLFSGFIYALILIFATAFISNSAKFDISMLYILAESMLFGTVGGILGINTKK